MFLETFSAVQGNFQRVFQTLFGGGECELRLANPDDPLESEIDIHAAPRGKRTQRIHLLSSGERTLVAVSLLFSIYLTKPSPFCLMDEVDAPLDDANVGRFTRLAVTNRTKYMQDRQLLWPHADASRLFWKPAYVRTMKQRAGTGKRSMLPRLVDRELAHVALGAAPVRRRPLRPARAPARALPAKSPRRSPAGRSPAPRESRYGPFRPRAVYSTARRPCVQARRRTPRPPFYGRPLLVPVGERLVPAHRRMLRLAPAGVTTLHGPQAGRRGSRRRRRRSSR